MPVDPRLRYNSDALRLSKAAAEQPDAVFLADQDSRLTFAEAARLSARVARYFELDRWSRRGQSDAHDYDETVLVAIEGRRSISQLIALCAVLETRVPCVVLHPRWVARERAAVLSRCRVQQVLTEADVGRALREDSAVEEAATRDSQQGPHQRDRLTQLVLFTSGTSGVPKGVRLRQEALIAAASSSAAHLKVLDTDRWLLNLPLAHVGGLSILTRTLCSRGSLVVADEGSFEPGSFVATIERTAVSLASVVPTMLHRLVAGGFACPESIRAVLVGGARAPQSMLAAARDLGWPVLSTYGLTEASSQVATEVPGDEATLGAGATQPPMPLLPGMEARISGAERTSHGSGAGRIEIRGPALFSGYLGEPSRSASDWFSTGDLGVLRERGLEVLGRCDDVLISGGENVAPSAVESVLEGHPAIQQACVVGLPDEQWGRRIVAVLQRIDGAIQPPVDYEAFIADELAAHSRPRLSCWVSELPLTAGAKVDRRACLTLAERASEGNESQGR